MKGIGELMAVGLMRARCYFCVPDAHKLSVATLTQVFTEIKELKVNFVRISLPWAVIQSQQSRYVWSATDEAINAALACGVQPMVVLSPPVPAWADLTKSSAAFGLMAGAVATRYRPGGSGIRSNNAGKGVLEYQIWDEPNAIENWSGAGVSASGYTAFLKAAYSAIKAAQPAAVVIFAGLQACLDQRTTVTVARRGRSSTSRASIWQNREPAGFLADAYGAGAKNHFDIMAFHPESISTRQKPKPAAPSLNSIAPSEKIYALMSARGDSSKKIYWTAVGYDTALFTELQQRDYLNTMKWLAHARATVTGFGVYCYRDF